MIMKLWLVSFDNEPWRESILVNADNEQDALDEAADSKYGQFHRLDEDSDRFKDNPDEGGIIRLGNHGDPFDSYTMHMRRVTPEEVIELGMRLEPVNMDAEDMMDALIHERGDSVMKEAWELMSRSGDWTKREYLHEKQERIREQIKRMLEEWPSYEKEEGKEKWILTLT